MDPTVAGIVGSGLFPQLIDLYRQRGSGKRGAAAVARYLERHVQGIRKGTIDAVTRRVGDAVREGGKIGRRGPTSQQPTTGEPDLRKQQEEDARRKGQPVPSGPGQFFYRVRLNFSLLDRNRNHTWRQSFTVVIPRPARADRVTLDAIAARRAAELKRMLETGTDIVATHLTPNEYLGVYRAHTAQ